MLLAGVETKDVSVESEGWIVRGDEGADDEAVESAYCLGKCEYGSSILLVGAEDRREDFVTNLDCDDDRFKLVDEK